MNRAAAVSALLAGSLGGAEPVPPPTAPSHVVVATARGETRVPVVQHEELPALAVERLTALLPVTYRLDGAWAEVAFADAPYHFLLDAPVLMHDGRPMPLVGGAFVQRDSLYVPLQWLAEFVPRQFREGYRYDPVAARFEEARLRPAASARAPEPAPPAVRSPTAEGRRRGFRTSHLVVVDAGHGGPDPGNPGRYLPRGVQEKHVTLAVARLVRDELEARGIGVRMTRDADTLIALRERAPMCRAECDLFVSIHVNSLPQANQRVSGVETYFVGEARTAEARRVAAMENDALRYETGGNAAADEALTFIFKDLYSNEFLRESATLAEHVQHTLASVHPGGNRGVAQNDFVVLNTARRPAILVEIGFATHRGDAQYLASGEGQRQIARAIADGIEAHLRSYEDKVFGEVGR